MSQFNRKYNGRQENPSEDEQNAPGKMFKHTAAENRERKEPGRSGVASNTQPQHSGCFTMIPPNQSRRSEILSVAQREETAWERWREENRIQSVHTTPQTLGGGGSESEAREKLIRESRNSKLQKQMKKATLDKKRRQEEEEELQRMKAEQRQKADRLEEKQRQEQQRRREQFEQDHLRTNDSFLRQFESRAADRPASSGATRASSRGDDVEKNQKTTRSERDVQLDHRRVNSAFLDQLEGRASRTEECLHSLPHLTLSPESESTGVSDPDPNDSQTLTRLSSDFPDYAKDFLQDVLEQCGGDYHQAFALLIS